MDGNDLGFVWFWCFFKEETIRRRSRIYEKTNLRTNVDKWWCCRGESFLMPSCHEALEAQPSAQSEWKWKRLETLADAFEGALQSGKTSGKRQQQPWEGALINNISALFLRGEFFSRRPIIYRNVASEISLQFRLERGSFRVFLAFRWQAAFSHSFSLDSYFPSQITHTALSWWTSITIAINICDCLLHK